MTAFIASFTAFMLSIYGLMRFTLNSYQNYSVVEAMLKMLYRHDPGKQIWPFDDTSDNYQNVSAS